MQLLRLLGLALLLLFATPADARSVVDATGRAVQVPDRIERVMPAGPPAAVLLYTLAPEKMIGWPHSPSPAAKSLLGASFVYISEMPPLVRDGKVQREQIQAARPDVILGYGSTAPRYADRATMVQEATGIPVDEPPSVNRLLGLLWAGHTLYPEDLRAEAQDFLSPVLSDRARRRAIRNAVAVAISVIGENHMRVSRRFAAALVTALIAFGPGQAARAQDVVVFAAASLTNALDEAAKLFERQGGAHAKVSYAASSTLAKQIESGAPADIFISADLDWMNYLAQRHLIQPSTRRNLLGNRLVLIAPADSDLHVEIKPGFDLATLLKGGHLAMADTDSVPAGKYGKAALEKLGAWNTVQHAVAPAESVRAALLFVSRREAPLGIVYATDAAADPRVKIVGVFPEDTHPPIIYPAALTADSKNPSAARLLDFLGSPAAKPIFEKEGFTVLAQGGGA